MSFPCSLSSPPFFLLFLYLLFTSSSPLSFTLFQFLSLSTSPLPAYFTSEGNEEFSDSSCSVNLWVQFCQVAKLPPTQQEFPKCFCNAFEGALICGYLTVLLKLQRLCFNNIYQRLRGGMKRTLNLELLCDLGQGLCSFGVSVSISIKEGAPKCALFNSTTWSCSRIGITIARMSTLTLF